MRLSLKKVLGLIFLLALFIIAIVAVVKIVSNENLDIRDEASSQGEQALVLITYNIRYGGQTDERLTQIADYLAGKNPDIVAIQETYGFKKDGPKWDGWPDRKDTLEFIQKEMQSKGANMYITPGWGNGSRDTSLLSKFPIEVYEESQAGSSPAKIIKVKFRNFYLRIACVHSLSLENACQASKAIINTMNNYNDTINFIIGDFNTVRGTACYSEVVSSRYISACDIFNVAKCADTVNEAEWPPCKYENQGCNNAPYAIDHILYDKNSDFQVVDAYSDTNMKASDHIPVIAKFQYRSTSTTTSTAPACAPNCASKQCGSDGCGGNCGICSGQNVCINGICICQANCTNKKCGESDGCSGRCSACNQGYTCNTTTWKCESGECQKNCTNKQCGDDGCGGECGECGEGEGCIDFQCEKIEYNGDLNNDTKVDILDLSIVLANWKWQKENRDEESDVNRDGNVNILDVSAVIRNWSKKY